jgi:hypothetical protein
MTGPTTPARDVGRRGVGIGAVERERAGALWSDRCPPPLICPTLKQCRTAPVRMTFVPDATKLLPCMFKVPPLRLTLAVPPCCADVAGR